jgi:glycosyltransferase involved in cell wall biosynthesis
MQKISATIITFNEAANIERCLNSLNFVDEIIVVDSFSTDQTKEIVLKTAEKLADQLPIKFYENSFAGFGQQKNLAAEKASYEWIFNIDADEAVSSQLKRYLIELKQNKLNPDCLYSVKRLTNYCGKWIRYGGWYPSAVKRLYNKNTARFSEPHLHETLYLLNAQDNCELLQGDLFHYSFPTVKSQVLTNVKYAELGSFDLVKKLKRKPYLMEVLLKPVGKFFECYLIKRGFMDGVEGLVIALNAAYSMFMKYSFAYFNKA